MIDVLQLTAPFSPTQESRIYSSLPCFVFSRASGCIGLDWGRAVSALLASPRPRFCDGCLKVNQHQIGVNSQKGEGERERELELDNFNPFTAMLGRPVTRKTINKVPNLKLIKLFLLSHEHVKGLLSKCTVLKVDFVNGRSNILFAGVYVCAFQPCEGLGAVNGLILKSIWRERER